MSTSKADIITRLQKEILPLQGFKPTVNDIVQDIGLGPIKDAFPNGCFPSGAIHEFLCAGAEQASASYGFIAGILSVLMRDGGVCLWISSSTAVFPPAFTFFGVDPGKIIFVNLKKEKEILWALEEALRCNGLAAVIGEVAGLNFTDSRRLQLAVEQSRVTGFVLRRNPSKNTTTASVARWQITAIPSFLSNGMPGIGFPRWHVELLKIRNGKPGNWQVEWIAGKFRHVYRFNAIVQPQQKKVG
jgi:protein ImuA